MYTPTVRGGKKMSVGMPCLGKHWNGLTYKDQDRRSDFDNLPVPPIPPPLAALATAAAAEAGFEMRPDLCIMNYYTADAKLGVHQDKDERPETIAAGIPIVSVSLGDAARFVVGGLSRKDPTNPMILRSGDVLVRHGRSLPPALPRRDPHPARHRAGGHGPGPHQPDVPSVVDVCPPSGTARIDCRVSNYT